MDGFFQRLLSIDVGTGQVQEETLDITLLETTLGGKGLAAHLLLERNPPGIDPLSPENHLLFALGPATDTPVWGSVRYGMFTKSPLTGAFGESYSGGKAAVPMSRTGFDAVDIKGAADKPVWIEVSDTRVEIHDASELWGLDAYAAEDAIKAKTGNQAAVLVIGPAGENLVRFAVVENDYWRSAGRCGMGAVLGSKKIKGIAFHGSQKRPVADPEGLKNKAKEILSIYKDHKATAAYKNFGTPMMVAMLNTAGGFPTRYWSEGIFTDWEQINAEAMNSQCEVKPRACTTCFMACGKHLKVTQGRRQGVVVEGPEYETIYAFGGLCCINSIQDIAYFNDLCDKLGLDTISAGNMVALAMEGVARGRLQADAEYGNADHIEALLYEMAEDRGLGKILGQGIVQASRELGLEDLAIHVKGMEPAGYDPRALKGMGLAYAVSDRGACHLRSTFYKAELAGQIDADQIDGKAEFFLEYEDRCTLFDCLILCRFYRDFYWDELGSIVFLTTGLDLDQAGLRKTAARVTDMTRRFNLREGLTAADDCLPERMYNEPLQDGKSIKKVDLNAMVHDYYRLRGWDEQGVPRD
ncbi:MAG: aldehyde ferredoxin oxidoreductase family protein [Desulfovermiculus sp.]|nr:aldehyde ferredoxin oxidoreductase family protein [Desulfovermiculus sp.]